MTRAKLTRQEELVLYWLADDGSPDHVDLGYFIDHLDAGPPDDQDFRRDCDLAGAPPLSKQQFLDVLQSLIDRDYAFAAVGDVDWNEYDLVTDVRRLPDDLDPWDVSLWRTDKGLREIESIHRKMSDKTKVAESARRLVEETCAGLPFQAVVPPYILADEKILSSIEVFSDNETAIRLYYEFGMHPWTTVTIDQAIGELPPLDLPDTAVSVRSVKVGSVSVSLREFQLNVNIAQVVAEWLNERVASRVSLRRENFFDPEYDSEPKPIRIDQAMRRQVVEIVRSCLSAPPAPRGSKE